MLSRDLLSIRHRTGEDRTIRMHRETQHKENPEFDSNECAHNQAPPFVGYTSRLLRTAACLVLSTSDHEARAPLQSRRQVLSGQPGPCRRRPYSAGLLRCVAAADSRALPEDQSL